MMTSDAEDHGSAACTKCLDRNGAKFDVPITMAFQPIVDVRTRKVWAHEALVRGADGQGAAAILAQVCEDSRYSFDQMCRRTAIEVAARLGFDAALSINFLPNAVYEPAACIRTTLIAAEKNDFDLSRLIFELTEQEMVRDPAHLKEIMLAYKRFGFRTAIDDFGAGFAGLGLLSEMQPDIIKIDRNIISHIDRDPVRQAILLGILETARTLDIEIVCEGIERVEEAAWLADEGVRLMQGFAFARPVFEGYTDARSISWPVLTKAGQGRSA